MRAGEAGIQECIHENRAGRIPTCNILGVNIAAINMAWLLKFTEDNLSNMKGDYICVSNVYTTVMSYEDREYCAIQNGGIMAIPDGGPLSAIGKRRSYSQMGRCAGPEYMEKILQMGLTKGWRHYFYGSTKETLRRLYKKLEEIYPDLQVAGMYSPPFCQITKEEDREITEHINATEPDFIWVGLGAPKQEKWMAAHQGKVKGLMVGVGAGFDYMAGNIERAPVWMQKNNLEWLYRLKQEPVRLFGRYWHTNWKFIWHAYLRGK